MNHGIPGEAGIVDKDVDLAAAELGRFLDELLDVVVLQEVAGHGNGLAAGGIDLVGHGLGLGAVEVGDDHFGALVGEEPCAFGADALRRTRDDGHLARQEAPGVVQMACDLVHPVLRPHIALTDKDSLRLATVVKFRGCGLGWNVK